MRYISIIILFFCGSIVWGQTDFYSVYFKSSLITGGEKRSAIDKKEYGNYQLDENKDNLFRSAAGDRLIVNETGVYISKNKLLSISRTEVRENSAYHVQNGYLFGVIENDSVLTALEGELYYFLVPGKSYIYETNNPEFALYQGLSSSDYIIMNKEENEAFNALYIQFNSDGISLKELDLTSEAFDLRNVKNISEQEGNNLCYFIEPSAKEWKQIMQCFITYDTYSLELVD